MDGDELWDTAGLEADSGLDLLFPLYSFLHNTGHKVVCDLLITSFRDAQYVKENINKSIRSDMTLFNFLCHVNQTLKNIKEGGKKDSKINKREKSPLSHQATCSNQQKQHINSLFCPRGEVPKHSKKCTNDLQNTPKTTCKNEQQNNPPLMIQNLREKEKILVKLNVHNLLERDKEACRVLHELDLNFILNIILNDIISFKLDQSVREALCKLKKVRQMLVHANYNFTEVDFEKKLSCLVEAVTVIYDALHLSEQELQQRIQLCREEAKSKNKVHDILHHLASEAHPQYSSPDPSFVSPIITSQMPQNKVIEDLHNLIESQEDNLDPILLCGEQKVEKSQILKTLAFKGKSCGKFKLVLHLKDCHRKSWFHQETLPKDAKKAAQEFQDQVFACLANLVPHTMHKYGVDTVKAVIKTYQSHILFLINWNVSVLSPVQNEMQRGSWIITCNVKEPSKVGWQVLKLEPYTEFQVKEMLRHSSNSTDLLRCYDSFDSKDILSSLDMIHIFCEVSQTICTGTDFEVVEAYVLRTLQSVGSNTSQGEQDLLRLGKLAFNAIFKREFVFEENEISDIQKCVCNSFLYYLEGESWSFKHSVVRDLLAAKYVESDPLVACKNWVKDENVDAFKRVFKFVCFMWFKDNSDNKDSLNYMDKYLRTLLHVPDKRKSRSKEKKGRSGDKKSNQMKKREAAEYENKYKNPFNSWNYLLELDEACFGEAMRHIVSILADIPCWHFNVTDCLDARKLTRLEKVLKKVTLDKKDPIVMKLQSNTNIALLTELWMKLRCINRLYNCVDIKVTIGGDQASHLRDIDKLESFLKTIADTQVPLYISRYTGPLFSCLPPSVFKCNCMHNLRTLEVSVYDVESLGEVMACGALPSLKEVFIKVNLELTEQINLKTTPMEFPKDIPVHITFIYFRNIQQLLDSFKSRHRLHSLSIHGVYVFNGFTLNLSKFTNLESLNIRFEPECLGDRSKVLDEKDRMEVDDITWLPRYHWLSTLVIGLVLPRKVERLLLRNVEFLNDANQHLIDHFFEKYNVNRLLILDTQLSLTGVGKILCSQTEANEHTNLGREKKLRRNESEEIRKLAERRKRIPWKEREAMKWTKPNGKEVVITSDGELCVECCCFPCMCPSKVDRDGGEGCNSYERMRELIYDVYNCNVQAFSYTFNHCTIRKDMCGDLRVQCIMKCLTDSAIFEIDSRKCLKHLFHPLMLAQDITLKNTALSPVGVAKVAEHLRHIRDTEEVDPFSLTIQTSWHSLGTTSPFTGFKDFLKAANYLSVVHYRCNCTSTVSKCFHIKKTYKGDIEDVIQAESG